MDRYEFRVFAPELGWLASSIRRRVSLADYREGAETYLLIADREDVNLKIRDGALELKRLVRSDRGLQQWQPAFRLELPATREELDATLGQVLTGEADPFAGDRCTAADVMRRFAGPGGGKGLAQLFKKRWSFALDGCAVEVVDVLANGARLSSGAVESVDPEAVLRVRADLGLEGWENVSYVRALWRLLGWTTAGGTF